MKTPDDLLKEAIARGATIVDDSRPGQGFAEDDTHDPRYDDPAVAELEKRAEDAREFLLHHAPSDVDEETRRLRESNVNAVRRFRLTHQEDYVDWVPGKILWLGDFLCMLQKIRPDAFYAEYSYLGLRGLGFVVNGKPEYSGVSVANGNMPEWSQLRVDARGLPLSERFRGWRTVLLGLIQRGYITVDQCNAVFGSPGGPRSRPWYRTLYAIRNGRCAECGCEACECPDGWDYLRADNYAYEVPADVTAGKQQIMEPRTKDSVIFLPN